MACVNEGGTLGVDVFGEFILGGSTRPPEYLAKVVDWLRHPSSTSTLTHAFQTSGGPKGTVGNALRFDLGATNSLQRAAYVNRRLGRLRGRGRVWASAYFSSTALRTKVAIVARWNSANLDATDAGYVAELEYSSEGVYCILRHGPSDAGETIIRKKLDPTFGFGAAKWMEVGIAFGLDTVGNHILELLVRPNGLYAGVDFDVEDDIWFRIGRVAIARHVVRSAGQVGWQVSSRAGVGYVQLGSFRALFGCDVTHQVLPDDVTL